MHFSTYCLLHLAQCLSSYNSFTFWTIPPLSQQYALSILIISLVTNVYNPEATLTLTNYCGNHFCQSIPTIGRFTLSLSTISLLLGLTYLALSYIQGPEVLQLPPFGHQLDPHSILCMPSNNSYCSALAIVQK